MWSTSARSLRLWVQPTPLVDREREREAIHHRLAVEGVRLLTLTGPAGVGKTRLALAAAAELTDYFLDGVVLVDLAPLRGPDAVLPALAHALGVTDESSSPSLLARLRTVLDARRLLMVLDNFEHVLSAATPLTELLAACPGLALLVTSRVPLQLPVEHLLRVAPLGVPDLRRVLPSAARLARVPGVALFVARARARHADFALTGQQARLVAQLVAQLDGLPLALELAAARLDVVPLPTLVFRLEDRLRLLHWKAADVPERQHSLEAAIGWSYELLDPDE